MKRVDHAFDGVASVSRVVDARYTTELERYRSMFSAVLDGMWWDSKDQGSTRFTTRSNV